MGGIDVWEPFVNRKKKNAPCENTKFCRVTGIHIFVIVNWGKEKYLKILERWCKTFDSLIHILDHYTHSHKIVGKHKLLGLQLFWCLFQNICCNLKAFATSLSTCISVFFLAKIGLSKSVKYLCKLSFVSTGGFFAVLITEIIFYLKFLVEF